MKGKLILTVDKAKDRDKWLAVRDEGIGGSDVASILGYNPYKSAYTLWAEKTGIVEPEDISEKEYVIWGNKNEPNIADRFCELTGKKVRKCGTLADEEYPFMHANIDRWVIGENAGLECKTAGLTKSKQWLGDEIPTAYYLQCVFYMLVTGAQRWYIAALIGGNDFKWKVIERNEEDIEMVRQAVINFWNNNVIANIPPDVDGNESTTKTLKEQYPIAEDREVDLPFQAMALIEQWDSIKATEAELSKQKISVQNQLEQLLGNANKGTINDRHVVWTNQAGRVTVDSKMLREMFPAAYEACAKTGKPSRRFNVK